MAIKFGIFNSVDGDRKYTAADIGDYLRGIIYSGVYPDNSTSLQVVAAGGMTVEVQPGRAMLEFKYLDNDAIYPLTLSAGGANPRIDAIVAYMDLEERACGIIVKEGTPATTPTVPRLIRSSTRYEVMLASVYVAKLATEVTADSITDTRHDNALCGFVRGAIQQQNVSIPVPTASTAGYIPHVTPNGTGYELLPTDTTLSFDGAVADAGAVGRALKEVIPISKGGTGVTTAAAARNALGLGNTTGAVPIANGGTGATTAENARTKLGITPENIGAVSFSKLWENSSPTSSFAAQTVSLDLTGYDFILVQSVTSNAAKASGNYHEHNTYNAGEGWNGCIEKWSLPLYQQISFAGGQGTD